MIEEQERYDGNGTIVEGIAALLVGAAIKSLPKM